MTHVESLPPPRTGIGPIGWLRQNLFSTWYNALLTIIATLVIGVVLLSIIEWAVGSARWGAISTNMTLFMLGQYPREQVWRVWAVIYLLALLLGLSWGVWQTAVRGFALIAVGASLVFALSVVNSSVWPIWIGVAFAIGLGYLGGRHVPGMRRVAVVGGVLSFPIGLLLISGLTRLNFLPQVPSNLWGGLLLTLVLTVVGNLVSLPLGILLALGRRSRLPVIHYFCVGYIELIRGVPLITILYMAANMLPFFLPETVRPELVVRAMIGLILFEAAYQAENVRGGLQAIPRGQYEAAYALGLNPILTTLFIILPQALRLVIPALLNSFVSLFKDTSLVAIVGLFDLLRIGRSVLAQSDWLGTHREVFAFAFLVYWGINLALTYGGRRLERALGIGQR
ncbi:Inner membrane amino-acid ABC transporter permease protein YhdY [Thermoflexales bacterium]|nr:Inner membrane amino-acid ABC transporter permease protein YhdY [Thermoflexales bacterium]